MQNRQAVQPALPHIIRCKIITLLFHLLQRQDRIISVVIFGHTFNIVDPVHHTPAVNFLLIHDIVLFSYFPGHIGGHVSVHRQIPAFFQKAQKSVLIPPLHRLSQKAAGASSEPCAIYLVILDIDTTYIITSACRRQTFNLLQPVRLFIGKVRPHRQAFPPVQQSRRTFLFFRISICHVRNRFHPSIIRFHILSLTQTLPVCNGKRLFITKPHLLFQHFLLLL